jgi:hypothetical protein
LEDDFAEIHPIQGKETTKQCHQHMHTLDCLGKLHYLVIVPQSLQTTPTLVVEFVVSIYGRNENLPT